MKSFNRRNKLKILRKRRRKKISGDSERPRLCVHFSNKHAYAQIVDDSKGCTIVSYSSLKEKSKPMTELAATIGEKIAKKAIDKKIKSVVFDRGGFKYHGKVVALADASRKAGLKF